MSGSQLALVGGRESRWITNPRHLAMSSLAGAGIKFKSSQAASIAATNTSFFTWGARCGAQASISVADTYVTLCSLTGAGFLGNVVSPAHSAAFTPTIRITVDGTAHTLTPTSALATAGDRIVLGSVTPGTPIILTGTSPSQDVPVVNAYMDDGFFAAMNGMFAPVANVALPSPLMMLSTGMPMLRFEKSLIVEVKASLLSADAAQKQGLVTYRLEG